MIITFVLSSFVGENFNHMFPTVTSLITVGHVNTWGFLCVDSKIQYGRRILIDIISIPGGNWYRYSLVPEDNGNDMPEVCVAIRRFTQRLL